MATEAWTSRCERAAGEKLTCLEVTADEVAVSLRWATATLTKTATAGRDRTWDQTSAEEHDGQEPSF